MIKGPCDFMERSSLLYVTTLSGLVAISIVVVEIKCFWFIMWPHGLNFFEVSHHFSGHRPCGSSGTTAKIAYMNVQDQLIKKRSEDFIEGKSSLHTHTAKTDSHRHCINDYLIICCVILQDHLIIWSCDFKGKSHSK